ncbi:MAG: hypothetical protein E6Y92_15920, partial [Eggerthella sp.]|nr:hypothetical protein [Eggerthella sp.]
YMLHLLLHFFLFLLILCLLKNENCLPFLSLPFFLVVLGGGLIDFYIHFVNERFEMLKYKKPTTEFSTLVVSVCRLAV